jgi:CRISPR-associated protein Csm3
VNELFEKLEKRLIFKGKIEAVTPLHIGSGKPEIELGEVDMPIIKDTNDQPYIPGSSLKGKTRAEAERILRKEGAYVCFPPDTRNMCGSRKGNPEEFCLCCKIFGTAGEISVSSKTRFRDAYPTKKVETLLQRTGTAIDRETGTVSKGALYSIEAVPAGTVFDFEIVAENLTDEELKLLCAALKSVEHSALGGSSSRGFGKVKIDISSVVERTAKYYLGQEGEKEFSGESLKKWLGERGCL